MTPHITWGTMQALEGGCYWYLFYYKLHTSVYCRLIKQVFYHKNDNILTTDDLIKAFKIVFA